MLLLALLALLGRVVLLLYNPNVGQQRFVILF